MKGRVLGDRIKRFVQANTLVLGGYYTRPSFLILGVQRGGTTALHANLSLHPQVQPGVEKEIHFFDRLYNRGLRWYHTMFPLPYQLGAGGVTFEATPSYIYRPDVPERIHRYDPKIKLILLLRNPIDRAFSAWNMPDWPRYGYDSFDDLVREELIKIEAEQISYAPKKFGSSLILRGLYYLQIERYLALFPHEQLLIVETETLRRDTPGTMHKITQHLGLGEHSWETEQYRLKFHRTYSDALLPETRAALADFYRPYNEKLYDLLDVQYGWQ